MTPPLATESPVERIVETATLVVFWSAFSSLALGLALWVNYHSSAWAPALLAGGLLALMMLPSLRLVAVLVRSRRERDSLTMLSTLVVLAILFAFTFRDATNLR